MVQIENEFGSYGDDKVYLHHLVRIARRHLGDDVILFSLQLLQPFPAYAMQSRGIA